MRDAAEFDDFYAATSRRIVGTVYAMTGDLAEAEDAVAEAFLKAWARWSHVRTADSPEAWVRRVASRNAISSWRKALNRRRAHDRSVHDSDLVTLGGLGPDHVAVVAALKHLSADQRRVIVLHHLVGLSVDEVAHEVSAPTGTVKARLARGRRALAEHLDETQLHDAVGADTDQNLTEESAR